MQIELAYNGIELSYQKQGSGKPILLLHGFGEDASIWDGLLAELSKTNLVITPQMPGSGGTAPLVAPSIKDFAKAYNAILEEENIESCTIIGHSMGGYIAMAFAEMYPQKIAKLGLFHSTSFADSEEKVETRKKAIQFIEENGVLPFFKTSTPGLFADVEKWKVEIDALIDKAAKLAPQTVIDYYKAMMTRPDLHHILSIATYPVLVISGKFDKAVPPAQNLKEAHLAETTHYHLLEQSAHMSMIEESDQIMLILKKINFV